jgi:hypothetical protein
MLARSLQLKTGVDQVDQAVALIREAQLVQVSPASPPPSVIAPPPVVDPPPDVLEEPPLAVPLPEPPLLELVLEELGSDDEQANNPISELMARVLRRMLDLIS